MRQEGWRLAVKKATDRLAAFVVLVAISPLLLLVAAAVWAFLGRPVLFSQLRPGLKAQPFRLVKFRTMTEQRDASGHLLPDAQRLTPLGRFLRSTSLDELPQFRNVLRGELSLAGPRPLLIEYLERYTPEQARRHEVLPGITGWAQINGRNAITWEQKFEHDIWYVDHWSLSLDARILMLTFWQVLTRKGIVQPGHETMPEFLGSNRSLRTVPVPELKGSGAKVE